MTKLLPDPKKSFRIYKQIRIKDKRIKTYIRKMGCKSLKYTFMKTRFCVNGGGGLYIGKYPAPSTWEKGHRLKSFVEKVKRENRKKGKMFKKKRLQFFVSTTHYREFMG
jgi:hypothetical protein